MEKNIFITVVSLMLVVFVVVSFNGRPAYDPIKYYNRGGLVAPITKVYRDTFNVNTSNGYTIDLTPAGFASIKHFNVIALRNTSTSTSVPNACVKSITTTTMVVNLVEGNGSLINILGSNVLLGPSTAFAASSGLLVAVEVKGN